MTTAFLGADADGLRRLGQTFASAAQSLQNIRKSINSLIFSAQWMGSEADQFRSDWNRAYAPSIEAAASSLQSCTAYLNHKAQQQVDASSADGAPGASRGSDAMLESAALLGSAGVAGLAAIAMPSPDTSGGSVWYEPWTWGNEAPPPTPSGTIPLEGPLFDQGGPQPTDVDQGDLGDCWFAGPLASLANSDPSAIEQMVHQNPDGTYTVTFHGPNGPVSETVDGNVYYDPKRSPEYGAGGNGAIWFPIVEKAYAQWQGGYGQIGQGGDPTAAMAAITGRSTSSRGIGGFMGMSDSDCWNQIRQSVDSHQVITASTGGGVLGMGGPSSHELVPDHCYSIIGYTTASDGTQMVEVRNPWGSNPSPNGEGWMSVDDFRSQFETMQWTH